MAALSHLRKRQMLVLWATFPCNALFGHADTLFWQVGTEARRMPWRIDNVPAVETSFNLDNSDIRRRAEYLGIMCLDFRRSKSDQGKFAGLCGRSCQGIKA